MGCTYCEVDLKTGSNVLEVLEDLYWEINRREELAVKLLHRFYLKKTLKEFFIEEK